MSREHSIYLLNTSCSPSRDQIIEVDKKVGECFLKPLNLEFCGYTIVSSVGKRAAVWDLPADQINEAIDFVETHPLEGYSPQVWVGVEKTMTSPTGTHLQHFNRRLA